jgi:hypothetical protein
MDLILKQFFFLLIILHIHIKFDGACQIDLRTYLKHLICDCLTLMLFLFMDCKSLFHFIGALMISTAAYIRTNMSPFVLLVYVYQFVNYIIIINITPCGMHYILEYRCKSNICLLMNVHSLHNLFHLLL